MQPWGLAVRTDAPEEAARVRKMEATAIGSFMVDLSCVDFMVFW